MCEKKKIKKNFCKVFFCNFTSAENVRSWLVQTQHSLCGSEMLDKDSIVDRF